MQDKDIDLSDIPEITEEQFKKAKLRFGGKPIQKSHSGRIGSKTVINAKYQKPNAPKDASTFGVIPNNFQSLNPKFQN